MEHGNNIDMMTLSWFVPEIRESLQHVAHALDELRANPHGQDAIKHACTCIRLMVRCRLPAFPVWHC